MFMSNIHKALEIVSILFYFFKCRFKNKNHKHNMCKQYFQCFFIYFYYTAYKQFHLMILLTVMIDTTDVQQ